MLEEDSVMLKAEVHAEPQVSRMLAIMYAESVARVVKAVRGGTVAADQEVRR